MKTPFSQYKPKKVVIVGAGMSGMTAGIYLRDNGFDVEIYEKHSIAGGECTGWVREGQYIDGCAHWIIGTNPNSCLYPIWDHIGAFQNARILPTEALTTYDIGGKNFVFHSDIKKLEEDLIALSPEDKKQIRSFIKTIERYTYINIPVKKPIEYMNPFEFLGFGLHMLPVVFSYIKARKMSVGDYAKRFKDPRIGKFLTRFMGEEYNIHSLFYVLQAFCTHDAGVVEGGSLKIATRVANTFRASGGKLFLNAPVKRIVIENGRAKGIELESGEFVEADYVISSADVHHTFESLLPNMAMPSFYKDRFERRKAYPLRSAFQVSLQTTHPMEDLPRMMDFEIEGYTIGKDPIPNFAVRNFSFDKTLSRGQKTLLTILLPTGEATYDYLASLSEEDYRKEKERVGETFLHLTSEKLGIPLSELKLLDVVSPLTYTHYTNAYKGAYMSFVTTKESKGLMTGNRVKGIKGLFLTGQWLMPPGGLPIAIMTGKHAAFNICLAEHLKFQNKEKAKSKGLLKTRIA